MMKLFRLLVIPLLAFSVAVFAQTFPSKPVRVVVPYPPGGGVDLAARLFAPRLSGALGQPMVVDNRPGATGAIAAEAVMRAAPDGHTLLFAVGSEMVLRRFLDKNPAYDIDRDFTPIAAAVETIGCVAAGAQTPIGSIRELIEFARRNPGKLNYGTSGTGSSFHLYGEALKLRGVDLVHVPFKGVAPAMIALLGAQIELVFTNLTTALPPSRDGKVKILALTQGSRFEGMPDVPTLSEALPGFEFPLSWYGYFGPAGMPGNVVARLNAEVVKAQDAAEVRARIREVFMLPVRATPEQFAAIIASSADTYARIVRAARIQPR